jgi:hypothetical protein
MFGDVARSITVFLPVAKFFRKVSLFRRDLVIYAHLYHRTGDSEQHQVVVIDFGQAVALYWLQDFATVRRCVCVDHRPRSWESAHDSNTMDLLMNTVLLTL